MKTLITFKTFGILFLCFFISTLLLQCDKSEDTEDTGEPAKGVIHFKCDMIGSFTKSTMTDTNVCAITSIKWTIEEIAVSTEAIVDGETDDIEWTTILTNDQLKYFDDYEFSFELPVGNYPSIKIMMKNRGFWICEYNDTTYEFEDFNCSECDPDGESPVNYFYTDGLHYIDEDSIFYMQTENERIGGFEIKESKTTTISWIINLVSLEWIDVNENGVWDTGTDRLDNWKVGEGKETMFDFIISYE